MSEGRRPERLCEAAACCRGLRAKPFTGSSRTICRGFTVLARNEGHPTVTVAGDLIAHRLGRAYGPDNSDTALRRSLTRSLEGLETDVCLTADGELVLLHDPLLSLGTT